jgi:rSAM/selenodomain-associated transferase 2
LKRPEISVVIPVLNEQDRIGGVINELRQDSSAPFDIIVIDGGSTDGTVRAAEALGARVIVSNPGRGPQLAAGAAEAAGNTLWFLHVDSHVAPGALDRIRAAIDEDGMIGGNFRVVFDGNDGFSRWLTGFYAWFRRHGLYYGDSGIFIRRDIYDGIGGIQPMALMEDYDLTRRMEKHGATCCIDTPALITSSRKFAGRHPVSIVFGWLKIHTLYGLGVNPKRLAKIYYGR